MSGRKHFGLRFWRDMVIAAALGAALQLLLCNCVRGGAPTDLRDAHPATIETTEASPLVLGPIPEEGDV